MIKKLGQLMGAAEIGKLLDISRQRVQQLTVKSDFPVPEEELAMGKIWDTKKIQDWGRETGRLLVGYAFRDQNDKWHGQPERLSDYTEGKLAIGADASAKAFAGQTITVRSGLLAGRPNPFDGEISLTHTLITGPNEERYPVLFTHEAADLLAGTRTD
jgi:hypothetical protein